MRDNRRRHANTVHAARLFAIVVAGLAVCAGGLGFVWHKNQMQATGQQIKKYESELRRLGSLNEAARTNIARLSSTAELAKRYKDGWFKLEPIPQASIFIVDSAPSAAAPDGLRPVANERNQE